MQHTALHVTLNHLNGNANERPNLHLEIENQIDGVEEELIAIVSEKAWHRLYQRRDYGAQHAVASCCALCGVSGLRVYSDPLRLRSGKTFLLLETR